MLQLEMNSCSLELLIQQLEYQAEVKQDLVVPISCLSMSNGLLQIKNLGQFKNLLQDFELNDVLNVTPNHVFINHITDKLKIGRGYQNKLREKLPELYDHNVNELFKYESSKGSKRNYLLRIFNVNPLIGRAFLSDSFKMIDNLDVLKIVLRVVNELELSFEKVECFLSEKRMYCIFFGKKNEIGFTLSNSEVGHGKLFIAPRLTVEHSDFGIVWDDDKYQKTHLGSKIEAGLIEGGSSSNLLDEIKSAIEVFCSSEYLDEKVSYLQKHSSYMLKNPHETLVSYCNKIGLSEHIKSITNVFVNQGSTQTSLDLIQAVNSYAQINFDIDTKFKIESESIKSFDFIKKIDK